MSAFRSYERQALERLLRPSMPETAIASLLAGAEQVSLHHTGSGYFLTVSHPDLPEGRMTFSKPALFGKGDGVECGFVAFIENRELTLECHDWSGRDGGLPEDIRQRQLEITAA